MIPSEVFDQRDLMALVLALIALGLPTAVTLVRRVERTGRMIFQEEDVKDAMAPRE